MKVPMGPPPPKIPVAAATPEAGQALLSPPHPQPLQNEAKTKVPMGPPPPRIPVPAEPGGAPPSITQTDKQEHSQPVPADTNITNSGENAALAANSTVTDGLLDKPQREDPTARTSIPYTIPAWSERPGQPYFMEVLKDGVIIDRLDVSTKGAFMFGRIDICDFVLEHPSISRFHAVLQFKGNGDAFLYDLASTHGTFINKSQVKGRAYKDLHVGDVIRFGLSTRLYIFQGPSELMLPEGDLKRIKEAKILQDEQDREASLVRARAEASLAEGISWGMAEDAVEEAAEDDADEVTWQSYKGQLTEKQEKTRDKIIKRSEKVANMRKEIDAIKAKEIAQGGLTQGQQTQIARNEQRISQVLEELENLEETLNDSIRESIGAHARNLYGKKMGQFEDEDQALSDDDEFYDRTKNKASSLPRAGEKKTVETAETLLDKKECITKEIEEIRHALQEEKKKITKEIEGETEGADALDAFMSGLSNQIEIDKAAQLEKKIHELEADLERILYLLNIADPTGEAAKKRGANPPAANPEVIAISVSAPNKIHSKDEKNSHKSQGLRKPAAISSAQEAPVLPETSKPSEDKNTNKGEQKTSVYVLPKPRWLGATLQVNASDSPHQEVPLSTDESSQFIDYNDRKTALAVNNKEQMVKSSIEEAAPGLIIRKRKDTEKTESGNAESLGHSTSTSAESNALDAVALLLKHQKGYLTSCDELDNDEENASGGHTNSEKRKQKRKIGPEKPVFLDSGPDYESWVPPSGQTGDGRTSLNDRFGY
ncbi:Kanadaptin [Nymphaea thermarum]|nr:Kanadaptin [Nymphaea thermarum]